jgi:hypothetical protein
MHVRSRPKADEKPVPEIIDVDYEVISGPEPPRPPAAPMPLAEQWAEQAETISRKAHQVFDEIDAAERAAPRLLGAARSVFERFARGVTINPRRVTR